MTNHLETVARKVFKQAEITWQISVLIGWDERTRQTHNKTNITTATTNINDNIYNNNNNNNCDDDVIDIKNVAVLSQP